MLLKSNFPFFVICIAVCCHQWSTAEIAQSNQRAVADQDSADNRTADAAATTNQDSGQELSQLKSEESYDKGNTEIGFDGDTAGNPKISQVRLKDRYANVGVMLESETERGEIVACRYDCKGRSRKMCAGNSDPLYGGPAKIRFHKPGDPQTPAVISQFGLYLAYVLPAGTQVEAYDSEGKLLGSIATSQKETEFIGAKSKKPISYLRIVADPSIDPDFAFDDLVFDKPVDLAVARKRLENADDENAGDEDTNHNGANPLTRLNRDELYDKGNTEIDFDSETDDRAILPKTPLKDVYAKYGVMLESETKDSRVVAYRYNCQGRSEGMSAANSNPIFAGVIKIRFHKPGDANTTATINQFGLYLSLVQPNGTKVEAYDAAGKLIGSLATSKVGTEFLGAKSKRPISYLRIVPNEDIDDDFAFDDLVFDKPVEVKAKD